MSSGWLALFFGVLSLTGLVFLIRSATKLSSIYSAGPRIEWSSHVPSFSFDLKESGNYKISVVRPFFTGSRSVGSLQNNLLDIPSQRLAFQVNDLQSGKAVPVLHYTFLATKYMDSSNQIVPVADFTIEQPGSFQLLNRAGDLFAEKDRLLISPKIGFRGPAIIVATVFSGITFIAGLVLCILALKSKL